MKKAELRKLYQQKRKALSTDEAFLLSENIFQQFLNVFEPKTGQKVHIFIPILKFNEIDTQIFINYFLKNGIRVFVPKVAEKMISVEIFEDSAFEINHWGISEPISKIDSNEKDYDFVITPLLYCDKFGNRVGYGKGFYDEFFEEISEKSKKIGINYFEPDENIDDVWEKDIPLDYLVTPTEVLSFLD